MHNQVTYHGYKLHRPYLPSPNTNKYNSPDIVDSPRGPYLSMPNHSACFLSNISYMQSNNVHSVYPIQN